MSRCRRFGLCLLLLSGCGHGDARLSPAALLAPAELGRVRAAAESVAAAGATLRLDTYLWRDFMPVAPPDGQPLRAVLRITTADSSAFPPALRADAAWVLNGGAVWATWLEEARPRTPGDPTLEVGAQGGPKWGPGIEVDVVVRLRGVAGAAGYLRARDQLIHRTD